jgi:hypothetical protein
VRAADPKNGKGRSNNKKRRGSKPEPKPKEGELGTLFGEVEGVDESLRIL